MDHYYNNIMSNNNHNHTSLWNKCKLKLHAEDIQEEHEETGGGEEFQLRSASSLPLIPQQPQTPKEPMEFLSRSWSISAEEISKALASRHKHFLLDNKNNSSSSTTTTASGGGGGGSPLTRTVTSPAHMVSDHGISINPYPIFHPDVHHHHHHRLSEKSSMGSSTNSRRIGSISRWFSTHHHSKDHFSSPNHHNHSSSVRKKDRARVENAHMHALLSIAGLSAALAAVANSENENSGGSKMGRAMASATELLASHCIEMAEQSGIENDRIAGVVKSAVDIKSAGDLMTLTAAAATALRGEAALRSRLPKEGRRTASISPCDKTVVDAQCGGGTVIDPLLPPEVVEELTSPSCAGELMQHTRKGALRWKRVTVYINKKSQVMMKMKSKHVGGAFSKKDKCLVYGVCDQISAWPARKTERENIDSYFGLKTAQGFLEFKCKNKLHKKQWVDGIQSLLRQIGDVEAVLDKCMGQMTITHNPLHSIKSLEKEETISL